MGIGKKLVLYVDSKPITNVKETSLSLDDNLMQDSKSHTIDISDLNPFSEYIFQVHYSTRRGEKGYFKSRRYGGTFKITLPKNYPTGKRGTHHTLHLLGQKATLTNNEIKL